MDEREAVCRLKSGDISGLEVLVRRYQVQAVGAAYLICQDRALAEDIVQAAFVRAYERINQFDEARPFGPWFLRSVVNDAIKAAARASRHVTLEDQAEVSLDNAFQENQSQPAALLEQAETVEEVWSAISKLPPEQRAVIVMRYYLDLSETEISERLASPLGTTKWRLHAARNRLRKLLPSWLQPEDRKDKLAALPTTYDAKKR